MPSEIRVLDLFAGAGGLTAGLHEASSRFRTVRAVEWDAAAAASFEQTFGRGVVRHTDIKHWLDQCEQLSIDVIVGGPPCQGFSTLNKQEEEDSRNELWREYVEAIVRYQPKYFVVENVAAFGRSRQFELFQRETLPGGRIENYSFDRYILNAADFGAPQARRRAVMIGYRDALGSPGAPVPTHSRLPDARGLTPHRTVRDILTKIPIVPDCDNTFETAKHLDCWGVKKPGPFRVRDLHWSRDYSELSLKRFAVIPPGGNRYDLEPYPELMAPCWVKHKSGSGDVMGRLHWDKPSVTIRTEFFKPEKGRYLHPVAPRALTHYEAALLQGFPRTHRFVGSKTDIARQIGNAVPIPLGAAIGRLLEEQLVFA